MKLSRSRSQRGDVTSDVERQAVDVLSASEATLGYMIKPHGSLVSVSSIHCCTYTPDLSTR